jgi:hypothetical protein
MNTDWILVMVRLTHVIVALSVGLWLYAQPALAETTVATGVTLRGAMHSNDAPQSFRVLCYHDVRDNLQDSLQSWPEPTAIDTAGPGTL